MNCPVCSNPMEYLGIDDGDWVMFQDSYFCHVCLREFGAEEIATISENPTEPVPAIVNPDDAIFRGEGE